MANYAMIKCQVPSAKCCTMTFTMSSTEAIAPTPACKNLFETILGQNHY